MKKIHQTIDSLGPNPTQGQVAEATEERCGRLRAHIISGEGVSVFDETLEQSLDFTNHEANWLAECIRRIWLHDGRNG